MKVYQVEERYHPAFSSHDAKYLLPAENEREAREAAEKQIGEKKPYLLSDGLTVVEIFDPERLERLERSVANLEKTGEKQ